MSPIATLTLDGHREGPGRGRSRFSSATGCWPPCCATYPALAIVEMTPEITADARTLLLRHPLRVGDAMQLAQPVPFVAFDGRLVQAARGEGLTVITGRGKFDSSGKSWYESQAYLGLRERFYA